MIVMQVELFTSTIWPFIRQDSLWMCPDINIIVVYKEGQLRGIYDNPHSICNMALVQADRFRPGHINSTHLISSLNPPQVHCACTWAHKDSNKCNRWKNQWSCMKFFFSWMMDETVLIAITTFDSRRPPKICCINVVSCDIISTSFSPPSPSRHFDCIDVTRSLNINIFVKNRRTNSSQITGKDKQED